MQLDDPFPVERLPKRVQESILDEFRGHHPTALEIARVPDAHWLTLPGMGPTTLARLRSLTEEVCEQVQPSALTKLTADLLLQRYEDLLAQRDQLQAKLREIRDQLRASKAELWMRGIATQAE
jgi:hypothetical protein